MSDIKKVNQDLLFDISNLKKEFISYSNSGYIYSDVFESMVKRYNNCINKYNKLFNRNISHFTISDWHYSKSQKTIRETVKDSFLNNIDNLVERLELEIASLKPTEKKQSVPYHQLRKCFKMNISGCPKTPVLKTNQVFIGMPFDNQYLDSYEYGIKQALETNAYTPWRADEVVSNTDIMCKICFEIQSSGFAIFNISSLNPNVMLELGLAYGIGKPVILIKDKETKFITDLGSIEYIEYENVYDLMNKLQKALEQIVK